MAVDAALGVDVVEVALDAVADETEPGQRAGLRHAREEGDVGIRDALHRIPVLRAIGRIEHEPVGPLVHAIDQAERAATTGLGVSGRLLFRRRRLFRSRRLGDSRGGGLRCGRRRRGGGGGAGVVIVAARRQCECECDRDPEWLTPVSSLHGAPRRLVLGARGPRFVAGAVGSCRNAAHGRDESRPGPAAPRVDADRKAGAAEVNDPPSLVSQGRACATRCNRVKRGIQRRRGGGRARTDCPGRDRRGDGRRADWPCSRRRMVVARSE